MAASEGFPKAARLIRPTEFARVYEQRRTAARGPLVLYVAARQDGHGRPRLGLSVSSRIGKAVLRNRWKRRLREAFRRVQADLPAGFDYILVVRSGRPATGAAAARDTERTILELAGRAIGRPQGA